MLLKSLIANLMRRIQSMELLIMSVLDAGRAYGFGSGRLHISRGASAAFIG